MSSSSGKSLPRTPSSSGKSLPRAPFYITARYRSRHAPSNVARSSSEELEALQAEDLQAHDLLPADLRKLKRDLDFYNSIGRLVTFNKIIKDWVVWDRYGSCFRCLYYLGALHFCPIGLAVLSKLGLLSLPLSQLADFIMFQTLFHPSALTRTTVGAPQKIVGWTVFGRPSQGRSAGCSVLGSTSASSKVCFPTSSCRFKRFITEFWSNQLLSHPFRPRQNIYKT